MMQCWAESSFGLQHWYMVVGSGAVISAGIAMPVITRAFHPALWYLALGVELSQPSKFGLSYWKHSDKIMMKDVQLGISNQM